MLVGIPPKHGARKLMILMLNPHQNMLIKLLLLILLGGNSFESIEIQRGYRSDHCAPVHVGIAYINAFYGIESCGYRKGRF